MFALASAIWSVGAVMADEPKLAIGLGFTTALFWFSASVQLQDRRDALIREQRNRPDNTADIQYEELIRPD